MKDMTIHIDDSVDHIPMESRMLERRLKDFPGKSKREVAEMIFCDEIVEELVAAGVLS